MSFQPVSGMLDACVLAVLYKEDAYGYILTKDVKEAFEVSESTLYPVLRRLERDLCITAYDVPYQGRNRRYYRLTTKGKERLNGYVSSWIDYKRKIDRIFAESMSGGAKNVKI